MSDMHRLRNVRRAEIDDDRFRSFSSRHPKTRVQSKRAETFGQEFRGKSEINKTGPSNFSGRPKVGQEEIFDEPSGQTSRVLFELLAQYHCRIGLIIPMPWIRCRSHLES